MYGVISDTHCHNWTTFSTTNADSLNNRLEIILSEIKRAAKTVADAGGQYLFHAGDLFHVRGSIAPSVLNPTLETFKEVFDMGVQPVIICGNHDAEFRQTTALGSAIDVMKRYGCIVVNEPEIVNIGQDGAVLCVPWHHKVEDFYETIKRVTKEFGFPVDLVCHVALDNVFSHVSSNVADPQEIIKQSGGMIRHIFAGHLHTHKILHKDEKRTICSVGAIAHHNWGDASTKAGFITVNGTEVTYHASHAPQFVDLHEGISKEEAMLESDGNYVRATVKMTPAECKEFRQFLVDSGARGVTLICHEKPKVNANRMEIRSTDSLESVVSKYIEEKVNKELASDVSEMAQTILKEV